MVSAVVTTGSTVQGLVPGLRKHMEGVGGRGVAVISTLGNPSGVVAAPQYETDCVGVSGTLIAVDSTNNKIFKHVSGANGNVWNELGSYAFT